jgi:hypothetical protein
MLEETLSHAVILYADRYHFFLVVLLCSLFWTSDLGAISVSFEEHFCLQRWPSTAGEYADASICGKYSPRICINWAE